MSECGCASVCTDKYVYVLSAGCRSVFEGLCACVSESACLCMTYVLAYDYECLWCYCVVNVIQVVVIIFTHASAYA